MFDPAKIHFIQSPNRYIGRGGNKISSIVIHSMAGFYKGSISWFQNPKSQVSAHYLISKKGEITQMVKDSDRAWHTYLLNGSSIGIEHEDELKSQSDPHWVTPEMLEASASLVSYLMKKYDIPMTHLYKHNDKFVQELARKAGKPQYIHGDPANWPMDKYKALIQAKLDGK